MSFLTAIFKKKDEPVKTYDDFWFWFQKNEGIFFKVIEKHDNIKKDFFDKLSPKLQELKDGFFYLTGMCDEKTIELILTPDGTIKNIVFVEELVKAAPKIPGWKFTALKPALSIQNVRIDLSGYIFDNDTLSFYAKDHANYPDEIDLVIVHNRYIEKEKENIINGVYIFLDNFLGELNSVITIDNVTVTGRDQAENELIPIEKLKDFLIWRQKEFIEKYEGEKHDTENDTYSTHEIELKTGRKLVAIINRTLLDWDRKASHPWLMTIKIKYNGDNYDGLPDDATYELLDNFENEITKELKAVDGYLNIGRESGDNLREIYFACKEFRKSSKVIYELMMRNSDRLDVSYDIYKDKYWQTLERYRVI